MVLVLVHSGVGVDVGGRGVDADVDNCTQHSGSATLCRKSKEDGKSRVTSWIRASEPTPLPSSM
jgi:hypothetical protein